MRGGTLVDGLSESDQSARNVPARLLLADGRPDQRVTAWGNIIDAYHNHVAAAKFAVDGQIEESKVALFALDLQLGSDRPDVARPQPR